MVDICNLIKELGYKIKLDTNGFNPKMVEKLISFDLIDYIALDYKAPVYKFKEITKTTFNEKFFDTLDLLVDKNFAFEVRTTVHSNLLNENDINKIILDLKTESIKESIICKNICMLMILWALQMKLQIFLIKLFYLKI